MRNQGENCRRIRCCHAGDLKDSSARLNEAQILEILRYKSALQENFKIQLRETDAGIVWTKLYASRYRAGRYSAPDAKSIIRDFIDYIKEEDNHEE
jgi:hypothetical protein